MDNEEDLPVQCTKSLRRNQKEVVLKMRIKKMSNWLKNFINQLLENLKQEECIQHLKKIFGALI